MQLSQNMQFTNQAEWISVPDTCLINSAKEVLPAPFFRKVFSWKKADGKVKITICGLGLYELYLNGEKVGDHVLDPVVSHYDKRSFYLVYDVADMLLEGDNTIGVILGNGLYNCFTKNVWHFDKASWRDYPKLILQMEADNEVMLVSDETWKMSSGPIVFDGWRNGEIYDARLEQDDWLSVDYDDSLWKSVAIVGPPGGILQEQTMPPCKVMKTLVLVDSWEADGETVYDIGQNMTGWARITVSGEVGAEVKLVFGEKLDENKQLERVEMSKFCDENHFQTDIYILKGNGTETWEPRFSFHGFQYVQVTVKGKAEIEKIEGRVVHTAFDECGKISSSNEILNKLQECTMWSYVGNFVGIPLDCPHREKNGWTGDAHLACETGLFNFNSASSYNQWIANFADIQRPNGQLPGIVPSAGWGFNWGNGPAWDSAFILIPWYVYLYTGDDSAIRANYDAMKKYFGYLRCRSRDNIVSIGLGDWCHPDSDRMVDRALTDTGYYYCDTKLLANFAEILGNSDDSREFTELASDIKKSFNETFYKGNGIYADGEQTAMACALYQGLVDEEEKDAVLQKLVESIHANGDKLDFGILGAKYLPRVLSDNGYVELAYKIITQPEYPGWVNWLNQGATTLWESWENPSSMNHIMYGDISAWFYQYLAGITPDTQSPGFKHFVIKPNPVAGLDWIKAEHDSPQGKIKVEWEKTEDEFKLKVSVPENSSATVILPNGKTEKIPAGENCFNMLQMC